MKLSDELIVKIATDITLDAYSNGDILIIESDEPDDIRLAKSLAHFFNTVFDEVSKAQI